MVMGSSTVLLLFLRPASHAYAASIFSRKKRCFAPERRAEAKADLELRQHRATHECLAEQACSLETCYDIY